MKFKKIKMLSLASIISIASASSIFFSTNNISKNLLEKNANDVVDKFLNDSAEKNEITPLDSKNSSPILVDTLGPIVSYKSTIYGLDWYAGKRWSINLADEKYKDYFPGRINNPTQMSWAERNFMNWSFDKQRKKLWILTYGSFKDMNEQEQNRKIYAQTAFCINTETGEIIPNSMFQLDTSKGTWYNDGNRNRMFAQISALSNGKVLVYSHYEYQTSILYDPVTKTQTLNEIKNESFTNYIVDGGKNDEGSIRLFYVLPIATNVNIAVYGSINSDSTDWTKASGDLYLGLVNDNLKVINVTDASSPWHNGQMLRVYNTKGPKDANGDDATVIDQSYKLNSYVEGFSRSSYTTLDGRVYFTLFSKFFVFSKSDNNAKVLDYYSTSFEKGKEIKSFTMDVNENVFYKFDNDTKIYKMIIPKLSSSEKVFSSETYYNLSSDPNIGKYSNNVILYNVENYTGSIMAISMKQDVKNDANEQEDIKAGYGLASAIVANEFASNTGDSKGLLNGPDSILKTSDFNINQEILNSKLPSEITRNDLQLLNGGFLTTNNAKDYNGALKYPPFSLDEIDNANGTFTVSVYLDQIPWFAKTLPHDAIPKKITKKFNTTNKIENKVSWKEDKELSYDFKNTLPTKVTNEDVENFDPFQVSFNSRTVTDSNGNIQYPKKTYTISAQDDTTGTITISVKYDYLPLSSEVSKPLSYTATRQYNIFKSSDKKEFWFAGSSSNASSTSTTNIDVKTVPQLKVLSESSLLPSSVASALENNSPSINLLSFINTDKSKGYPISKMEFEYQADDTNGTLTIVAKTKNGYYSQQDVFRQTYTGLNKKQSYKFSFKENMLNIDGKAINTFLPSSVTEGNIINNFVEYSGFNSSDFTIKLIPNNENGSLTVQILLNKSYPSSVASANGFNDQYIISKTYSGFMTSNEFNKQYNIEFYGDDDLALQDLKRLTLDDINKGLVAKKLEVGGKTYNSLTQLVDELLVKDRGTMIPTDWKQYVNNQNGKVDLITTSMSFTNESGIMNISVKIDKSLLNGYGSDLNLVYSYSGFVKGNQVVTSDSLSFVSNELLKSYVKDVENMNASQFKEWLTGTNKKENLKKLFFTVNGQYNDYLAQEKYTLEVIANDAYNTVTILLKFDQLTNHESLTTYTMQYKL